MGRPMLTLDDEYYNKVKGISGDALSGSLGALQAARKAVTGSEIQERMNPYLEQVLGRQVEDVNERNRIEAARRAAQRGGMRAFGTRGAIGEAIARDLEQERLDTQLAQMRFQGFESAQNQVNTERSRDLAAGQGMSSLGLGTGNLATSMQQIGQQERSLANQFENDALRREEARIGMLTNAGALQQGAMAGQIQDSMALYNELQGAPYNQASFGNQILTGQQGSVQTAPTGSSPFSQILGLGATIAGLGVSGGGTLGGNFLAGLANGGRVGALKMANGGSVTMAPARSPLMYATDEELSYLANNLKDPQMSGMVVAEIARREAGGDRIGMTQAEMGALEGSNTGLEASPYEDPSTVVSGARPPQTVYPPIAGEADSTLIATSPVDALRSIPRPRIMPDSPDLAAVAGVRPVQAPVRAPNMPPPTSVASAPVDSVGNIPSLTAARAPAGALTRASGQGVASSSPASEVAAEEPSVWKNLLTNLTTVDPLTGKSPLYSFGVNMLAASANPDPGRGLLGNVGLSLKAMDEERKARATELLDARLKAAAIDAKSKTGNKATGLVARLGDGTVQSVLRDGDGDYIYRGGEKQYLADIQKQGEEVRVARPQELPAATAAKEAAGAASAQQDVEKINRMEERIDALSDEDLGVVGSTRKAASSAVGILGDLFSLADIDKTAIENVQKKIGDPENLRTLEVLEDGIYEMIVAQRREARGRAPTAAEQKAIRDLVSLQGMTDSTSVRARLKEIMSNLRSGAYKQMDMARIRGGADIVPEGEPEDAIELEPITME